ncbi:MAG: heavy metal-associated domain-containing protein [Planctomycetota bacterium]
MKSLVFVALGAIVLSGCQSESAPETVVGEERAVEATPVAFNIEGAPTAELEVPDMHCQYGCVAKVKEVLASQTGVKDIKIDFDSKKAIVAVNESEFDANAAVAALVDVSFPNSKLISATEN